MSQPAFNSRLALNVQPAPLRRPSPARARRELETKLADLQKDYAELHAAIFEAGQVHRRLCAPRLVRYGDFEIASEIFAVRHLAGDFFSIKDSQNGAILALGDICGKGLAASMWTTHLVQLVAARAAVHSEPEWIVSGVNRDVCLTGSTLASLFVAKLDPLTGRLDYCSAGHPPTLLLRANGELELLSDGGILVGAFPASRYVKGSVELREGDTLLAYTDGVFESMNKAEEQFGINRLERELRTLIGTSSTSKVSAENVLFSILAAVQDFAATYPLIDDLSLVVIRRAERGQ